MGPKLGFLGQNQFFLIFLPEINGYDKLCQNFNFGKNMMKFDLNRLKLGFYGP